MDGTGTGFEEYSGDVGERGEVKHESWLTRTERDDARERDDIIAWSSRIGKSTLDDCR